MRYEFLRSGRAGAWRPHEALTVAGVASLIERINGLRGGPATGAPLSFVMTTGDNTDNNAKIELDWFLAAMNGGRITPNTGDPRHYEGVQNSGLKEFWHPEDALRDADKKLGFPRIDGFLEAALRTVNSPGLRLPWYSTIGNHDDLAGGVYSLGHNFYADFATGKRKLEIIPADDAERLFKGTRVGDDPKGVQMKALLDAHAKDMRTVTPDERRAPFTQTEYLAAHLDPAATGPGPVGHGYTEDNLEQGTLYYSFRVSENVIGISLDTTDPGGHYTGSLGTAQLRWLERTLKAHKDDYVIVFSHHYSRSLDNMNRDPSPAGRGPPRRGRGRRPVPAPPQGAGLDQRPQSPERDHPAWHLLGDHHRLACGLPPAGPGLRGRGQPRRHDLPVHHAHRVGRAAPHGLLGPVPDRARGALPRAVLQRARRQPEAGR